MKNVVYVGIDLHKTNLVLNVRTAPDDPGELVEFPTRSRRRIERWFRDLATRHRVVAAVESVGFYQWFWALIEPLVDELHLADASQVRAAAGRRAKTDRNDAATIARLLSQESLPTAYVPDDQLRHLRDLVRHRERLVKRATSVKNMLRGEMGKLGLAGPRDLTAAALHKWFTAQYHKLGEVARLAVEDLGEQLALLERQLLRVTDRLDQFVEAEADLQEQVDRFDTLPGVARITAAVIHAETGGITRFDREEELVSYAGLAPRTFQSGTECRHGRISKAGPPILRRCLVQAAWTAVRCHDGMKRLFAKYRRTRSKKKAIIKVAAKLLIWAWGMARHGKDFDDNRIPV